jgi:hypothetical protein
MESAVDRRTAQELITVLDASILYAGVNDIAWAHRGMYLYMHM